MEKTGGHWEDVYRRRPLSEMSWYQPNPQPSLDWIAALELPVSAPIIDVGGGDSFLADRLLELRFSDVTVLDISSHALQRAKDRLGKRADGIQWIESDCLSCQPDRPYLLWHDRAVFHFMTEPDARTRYMERVKQGLAPGGYLLLATFSEEGPKVCSGLPVQRYSKTALMAEVGPEFEKLRLENHIHKTPSGIAQPFTYGLFRFTGSLQTK